MVGLLVAEEGIDGLGGVRFVSRIGLSFEGAASCLVLLCDGDRGLEAGKTAVGFTPLEARTWVDRFRSDLVLVGLLECRR